MKVKYFHAPCVVEFTVHQLIPGDPLVRRSSSTRCSDQADPLNEDHQMWSSAPVPRQAMYSQPAPLPSAG
ncbi:hypothetical protein [Streptomyces sp. NBC_00328]|uniref:hypothetical protein n=1 Tax=Streptomyces sp. NBC_00328 TaxID=2903646 RepID=UPI002E2C5EB1|nr:hypothetical protein [Streptomyces sp. NBC_00328]